MKRAIIKQTDDTGNAQTHQIATQQGVHSDVPRLQDYGMASNPPDGAIGIMTNLQNDPNHPIILVADDTVSRPKNLTTGEVVIYHQNGAEIRINDEGITISAESMAITAGALEIKADEVKIGKLEITEAGITIDKKQVAKVGDAVSTPVGPGSITGGV